MNLSEQFRIHGLLLLLSCLLLSGPAAFAEDDYGIQPGDILAVSVWKEEDLQQQVIVRPDGKFSFPLAGDIVAAGRTVESVRAELIERIQVYIPDPVVTVQLQQIVGNKVYVIGKVQRPGEFLMTQTTTVMQALAQAGGMATFAAENDISILRTEGGSQQTIPFRYDDVQYGRNLEQNIVLKPGDVIIVP